MHNSGKRAFRVQVTLAALCAVLLVSCADMRSSPSSASPSQVLPDKPLRDGDLRGRWEETSGPDAGAFIEFSADKTVQLSFKGRGIQDLPPNIALKYRFDPSQNPPSLDIFVVDRGGRELFAIKMIVDSVDVNAIRIAMTNDPNERPPAFVGSDITASGKLFKVR